MGIRGVACQQLDRLDDPQRVALLLWRGSRLPSTRLEQLLQRARLPQDLAPANQSWCSRTEAVLIHGVDHHLGDSTRADIQGVKPPTAIQAKRDLNANHAPSLHLTF